MIDELRRISRSRMLVATLAAVCVLPLIYGVLYLWAFWDPYGKLGSLPVAVVNEDACARRNADGERVCAGADLVSTLQTNRVFDWRFISRVEAQRGLAGRIYYSCLYIPEDFSASIVSVDGDSPRRATLTFTTRQATNFMASKFTASAYAAIRTSLEEKLGRAYFDAIFLKTRTSVEDLGKAADGSGALFAGTRDTATGSAALVDGTRALDTGATELAGGITKLYDGSVSLVRGFTEPRDGERYSYLEGMETSYTGAQALERGIGQVSSGAVQLRTGTTQAAGGAASLAAASGQLSGGIAAAASQSAAVRTALAATAQYLDAYRAAYPDATLSADFSSAVSLASQTASSMEAAAPSLVQLAGGQQQVYDGLARMSVSLVQLASGAGQVANGTDSVSSGVSALVAGLYKVRNGSRDLSAGASALRDGLSSAKTGAESVARGTSELLRGQTSLYNGISALRDGTATLRDRLAGAVEDARRASDPVTTARQAEVMAAPVDLSDASIDLVANNGTGFAPYFIPLSLWVGAMAVFFLIDARMTGTDRIRTAMGKLGTVWSIATVQAIVLDTVLIRVLGLNVRSLPLFVSFTVLLAWTSVSIQLLLGNRLLDAGKFVSILLLMLQLTSSAGSYPYETLPVFFRTLTPFLPMTYAVTALRELISGGSIPVAMGQAEVIAGILCVCIAGSIAAVRVPVNRQASGRRKHVR